MAKEIIGWDEQLECGMITEAEFNKGIADIDEWLGNDGCGDQLEVLHSMYNE